MGYGVLPGAGLASAEDMLRVLGQEEMGAERGAAGPASKESSRPRRRLSQVQLRELVRLQRETQPGSIEREALENLERAFREEFGLGLQEASYRQGEQMIAKLLGQRKAPAAQ